MRLLICILGFSAVAFFSFLMARIVWPYSTGALDYALTFSAITLRVMQFFLAVYSDIDPETAYRLVAWPSWMLRNGQIITCKFQVDWFLLRWAIFLSE